MQNKTEMEETGRQENDQVVESGGEGEVNVQSTDF